MGTKRGPIWSKKGGFRGFWGPPEAKALTDKDSKKASVLRKKISKLKKQTRLLAKDNKAAATAAATAEKKK